MIHAIRIWVWERRLAHAKATEKGLIREHADERRLIRYEVEHCETMVARVRIEAVRRNADRVIEQTRRVFVSPRRNFKVWEK